MVRKGKLVVFESSNISETREAMPTKIGIHVLDINHYLLNFLSRFQLIKFLMTMDYIRKGKLAIFESSNISETGEATPTKFGVHAFDINPHLHDFFEPIPID